MCLKAVHNMLLKYTFSPRALNISPNAHAACKGLILACYTMSMRGVIEPYALLLYTRLKRMP